MWINPQLSAQTITNEAVNRKTSSVVPRCSTRTNKLTLTMPGMWNNEAEFEIK